MVLEMPWLEKTAVVFFYRFCSGKFAEICAKILRTRKNLPAPAPMYCMHSQRAEGLNTDTDNIRNCKQLATTANNFVPKVAGFQSYITLKWNFIVVRTVALDTSRSSGQITAEL